MTKLSENMSTSAFGRFNMPTLNTFIVQRAGRKPDPYDPDTTISDWTHPSERTVNGYLHHLTALEMSDAIRSEATYHAELVIPDADADVERGDRVWDEDRKHMWTVQGFTATDMSPFTSWQPTMVVDLTEVRG